MAAAFRCSPEFAAGARRGVRCSSWAGRASPPTRSAELGVDKVFGRGTTPGEVAS